VPCGTALFLPVLNAEEDTVFPGAANGGPGTDAELKATVTNDMNFFLSQQAPFLKIGDPPNHLQAVDNVTQYPVQSPLFNITFPNDNAYQFFGVNVPGGAQGRAITEGIYVMIAPLSAGTHYLEIGATLPPTPTSPQGSFSFDIHYTINVAP